jgi:N-acetylmuramoyl-L-alanine amidase
MNVHFFKEEGMRTRTRKQPKWLPRLMKWMSVTLLACVMATLLSVAVSAKETRAATVPVRWNSTAGQTALSDSAYLIDGVTYVPFRAFAVLADNCEVSWNSTTRTAKAVTSGGVPITACVGEYYISYGGRCFYTVAPNRIVNNRLYVAIRPMAKCFAIEVKWEAASRAVALIRTGKAVRSDEGYYDADALYWLARIIGAEAKGEPFRGQVAVGNVVLNRVESREYPNTIYDVIFDKKYGVQFTPAANGTIYEIPPTSAIIAAKVCLEGYTLSDSILYFFNPSIATSQWIANNCTYAFRIGGHVFYR